MVEGPPFLSVTEHPWGFEHRSAGQTQPADEIGGRRGKTTQRSGRRTTIPRRHRKTRLITPSPSALASFLCNPNEPMAQEKPGTAPSSRQCLTGMSTCLHNKHKLHLNWLDVRKGEGSNRHCIRATYRDNRRSPGHHFDSSPCPKGCPRPTARWGNLVCCSSQDRWNKTTSDKRIRAR